MMRSHAVIQLIESSTMPVPMLHIKSNIDCIWNIRLYETYIICNCGMKIKFIAMLCEYSQYFAYKIV